MTDPFLQKLHTFFQDTRKHGLSEKIVFAAGTAPMDAKRSEIQEIFYATEFSKAYFVDPMYQVQAIAQIDLNKLATFAKDIVQTSAYSFDCLINDKIRNISFLSADATLLQHMPPKFTIYFSGKRIGMYPGFGLRGTPSDYLQTIVGQLQKGGYVVPDRELLDDAIFFPIPPKELGLIEIPFLRTKTSSSNTFSEDFKFVKKNKGVGVYKKI